MNLAVSREIGPFLTLIAILAVLLPVRAQEASVELGSEEIGLNQYFTITLTVENGSLTSYDGFPEIEGFTKRGTSQSSSTSIINGQVSSSESVTMSYQPRQKGVYVLKPFTVKINGESIRSEGKTITVTDPVQRRDPFRSLFDSDPYSPGRNRSEPEFIEVEDDAFLALSTDKKEVYVGEGFTADLSFYVAETNRAMLNFYELGKQLSGILKELRPDNCWEENFNIENINGESVTINGKAYTQYKIYEAAFYPLNSEEIVFPRVGLEMIKYKIARRRSFFGSNRQEDYKTYYSMEKRVSVKPLPPHPLRDAVSVGDYRLNETLSSESVETGESFKYDFTIFGEGNIASIKEPDVPATENFDFYDPSIAQKINRRNRRVTGTKTFSYFAIPNEPGAYALGDYFNWIFFNPRTEAYDTLKSRYYLSVKGESLQNEAIQATDVGSFYDRIGKEDNQLVYSGTTDWMKMFANIFILASIIAVATFVYRK